MPTRHHPIGEILVAGGALAEGTLESALDDQVRFGGRIGEVLVRARAISESDLAVALGEQLGLRVADAPLVASAEGLELIGMDAARGRGLVPIETRPRSLRVAVVDPLDLRGLDELAFRTGRRVEAVVATPTDVAEALDAAAGTELELLVRQFPSQLTEVPDADPRALELAARAAPVVRLVDRLIRLSIGRAASDLHLEGGRESLEVRLRIDGVLRREASLPATIRSALISRLKVMSGLDIAVKRRPQDGGFQVPWEDRELTIRLSTVPVRGVDFLIRSWGKRMGDRRG